MNKKDTPPPTESPEADNAAGAGCMARLVRFSRFEDLIASIILDRLPNQYQWTITITQWNNSGNWIGRSTNDLGYSERFEVSIEEVLLFLANAKRMHPHPQDPQ